MPYMALASKGQAKAASALRKNSKLSASRLRKTDTGNELPVYVHLGHVPRALLQPLQV